MEIELAKQQSFKGTAETSPNQLKYFLISTDALKRALQIPELPNTQSAPLL